MPSTLRPKQSQGKSPIDEMQEYPQIKGQNNELPSSLKLKSQQPSTEIKKQEPEENIFIKSLKEIPNNLAGQIALGFTQAVTSPLDLMKLMMQGAALESVDELQEIAEKEGKEFDYDKAKKKALEDVETSIPTLSMAEKWLQEQGISTEPQGTVQKITRGIAELTGVTPRQMSLKRKSISPETKALQETAEKHGLRKFEGMSNEKPPKITPLVTPEKEKKLAEELGETTKKAIDDMISQKIPVKKMRDQGVNLEDAYTTAYKSARKTASEMGDKPVDLSEMVKWIDSEIKRVKGISPSLGQSEQAYIKVLKKEKAGLTSKSNPKEIITHGPEGEVIRQVEKSKITQKPLTAEQSLNQYQQFNDNVKGIYRKPEFAGAENAVRKAYGNLNEKLIWSIEKTNPELAKELKFANKIFHETSKLEQVEGILSKSFKNGYSPKKLSTSLSNKRERAFLERNLGKDSINSLEDIAKYGQEAEKRVFANLKNPKTAKEYLEKMTPLQLGLIIGYKGHVGLPFYVGKEAMQRIQGHLFTRNKTKKAMIDYIKTASQIGKSPESLLPSANKLSQAIKDEFGSEEELIEIASED